MPYEGSAWKSNRASRKISTSFSVSGYERQSIGLLDVGGELGDKPLRAAADRGGETDGVPDLGRGPLPDDVRRTYQVHKTGDVQIGLVNGDLSDQGGDGFQQCRDLPRDVPIA